MINLNSRVKHQDPMYMGMIGDGLRTAVEMDRYKTRVARSRTQPDPENARIEREVTAQRLTLVGITVRGSDCQATPARCTSNDATSQHDASTSQSSSWDSAVIGSHYLAVFEYRVWRQRPSASQPTAASHAPRPVQTRMGPRYRTAAVQVL